MLANGTENPEKGLFAKSEEEPADYSEVCVAAGALNVTRHGLGSGQRDHIEQLARHVEVQPTAG